ncbi:MAG: cation:proton antiporter [Bacteroidales bacterium]|jgi:Kef-type K+ transport system membrane component KefB/nucleotide-binding universal stress UspA family protein|nr:cation:proton antiporter [Bacteroidales bacterium]
MALCLFIMLVIPPFCKKIGMPAIFGLILAGIAIGPNGFYLISEKSGLDLFSSAGLLYLMFLMTLEIDIYSFRKNKLKSVWFGAFTFLIPFVLGFLTARFLLHYDVMVSLLLSCMFASHTLVSYPIASRLNITKTEPVVVSIGGTIITDVAVLLLLTILTATMSGTLHLMFWVKTTGLLAIFILLLLWGFPRICRWYFSHFQSDEPSQYIFVMCSLFASGFLAKLTGIEPIVGAFLCGLALNRIIPHQSSLMNRTVFIGNTLFIPFFMIHIGMMVDMKAFFQGTESIVLAGILTLVAISGKYLAALATRLIYGYTRSEGLLLFGLSSSRAAATIAVVLIGYRINILDTNILNATVIIIILTCLVSTYYTDRAGRKVALQQEQEMHNNASDHILVSISNPGNAILLFDFSLMIHKPHEDSVIHPVTIVTESAQMEQSILRDKKITEYFKQRSQLASVACYSGIRLDSNISEGIIRATVELQATHIVMGWSGQSGTGQYFFGTIMENLLKHCKQTILVTKLITQQLRFNKMYILVPRNADHETGFHAWLTILKRIWRNSTEVLFISDEHTASAIAGMKETASLTGKNYRIMSVFPDMPSLSNELTSADLLVVISARQNTVSYSRKTAVMPRAVMRFFERTNCVILYPEQPDIQPDNINSAFSGL